MAKRNGLRLQAIFFVGCLQIFLVRMFIQFLHGAGVPPLRSCFALRSNFCGRDDKP